MIIKPRHLFGSLLFIRNGVLALIVVAVARVTFCNAAIIVSWPPPPPPPSGSLQVIIDAPANINSAVQWSLNDHPNEQMPSAWHNNGDMVSLPSGSYYITFRTIVGWATPASQPVWISANATNTFFGSYNFVSLNTDYQGLFSEASGPKFESCGFCEISSGKKLSFTGKIISGGNRYSFAGKFEKSGNAWSTIRRSGAPPLTVHLVAATENLTGEITDGTWTATFLARRNMFDSRANPAPQVKKFTFAFPSSTNSAALPGGNSFGMMTMNRSGAATMAVTLADGTKASQSAFLGQDGRWPFYISLYSGKGFAFGWLQLENPSDSGLTEVQLFEYCNYGGERWEPMPLGEYDFSELPSSYRTYNTAWSAKVPYGQTVTLYTNDHFGGDGFTITTNNPCIQIGPVYSIRLGVNAEVLPAFANVTWMKPPVPGTKFYPAGFTNQMQFFVSPYQSTDNAALLGSTNGIISFQNGDSSQSLTNTFSMDLSGKIRGANDFILTISASSGSLKGKILNPLTQKVISFSGVVLQRQHFGCGFFLDGGQSGNVYLGPAESE